MAAPSSIHKKDLIIPAKLQGTEIDAAIPAGGGHVLLLGLLLRLGLGGDGGELGGVGQVGLGLGLVLLGLLGLLGLVGGGGLLHGLGQQALNVVVDLLGGLLHPVLLALDGGGGGELGELVQILGLGGLKGLHLGDELGGVLLGLGQAILLGLELLF